MNLESTTNPDTSHIAKDAWSRVGTRGSNAREVIPIQEERLRSVYRVVGAGPSGSDVIVKRCKTVEAERELAMYRWVLPKLGLPRIHWFGTVTEDDREFSWLMIEDAAGRACDLHRPEDVRIATQWLSRFHLAGAQNPPNISLRDRGADEFVGDFEPIRMGLDEGRRNPALADRHKHVLTSLAQNVDVLMREWPGIEDFCAVQPHTLVHGDFKPDNCRIRDGERGEELITFDWNESGFGVPALDLAKFVGYWLQSELETYVACVEEVWPALTSDVVLRLGYVGEAFRCLRTLRWELPALDHPWVEKPMSKLAIYDGWLRDIIRAEPWSDRRLERQLPASKRVWN